MIPSLVGAGVAVSKGIKKGVNKLRSRFPSSVEHINSLGAWDPSSGIDEDQWNSNPYAQFDYRHSGIQKFLENLGFRTKYDEFTENMALNAREYNAQLAEKAHNEEYDSALSQAQRMRAAGINPDLAGNVDAGSSSEMEPDPNAPISPGHDDINAGLQTAFNFGSLVLSGMQNVFALADMGFGYVSKFIDIKTQKLDFDDQKLGFLKNLFRATTNPDLSDYFKDSNGDQSVLGYGYSPGTALHDLFGRRAKKYAGALTRWSQGLEAANEKYSGLADFAKNRTTYFDLTSGIGYSSFDDLMAATRKVLSDYHYEVEKITLDYQKSKATYDKGYFDKLDPDRMATADMVYAEEHAGREKEERESVRIRNQTRKAFDSLISHFDRLAAGGNTLASIASMVMSFLSIRFLGM